MVVNVVFVVILMEPHLVITKLLEADMPMELLSESIGKKYQFHEKFREIDFTEKCALLFFPFPC